ncbi:MAG: hypothetical protein VZR09_05920 [Candidatus Gastranaerophilaceae bacterium]|nr:hypothetical protein [Candidatus Gastranaerophilaceae bacterium]
MERENAQVNCPYCGTVIDNSVEFCPNCKEWFTVPALKMFKYVSVTLYIIMTALCEAFGLRFVYSLIWGALNFRGFLKISNEKDIQKFKILFCLFTISICLTFAFKFFIISDIILEILLSYRMLRIIEKYTLKKYNSPVTHHEVGMILFRTLYVIYYMDTYEQRVKDPDMRYCWNAEKWIKYFIILFIILIILYLIGFISIPLINVPSFI